MNLPSDPIMLLSVVNMRLRDSGDSFDELCCCADCDPQQVQQKLGQIGYIYDREVNQFVRGNI